MTSSWPAFVSALCFELQVMALGHPVIVVQCPGVAMRLGPVLPADQVVEQVVGVFDKLGVEQACVIGHSYGRLQPWTASCAAAMPAWHVDWNPDATAERNHCNKDRYA